MRFFKKIFVRFKKKEKKKKEGAIYDVTGARLTPSSPSTCEGNGFYYGFERCCDECDYFGYCFPQFFSDKEKK